METIKYFDRVKNEWININLKEKIARKGNDMRNDYDNRYTVRFHDLDLNQDFEETFEQFKPVFKSRNPFFIECIKRGLRDFQREYRPLDEKGDLEVILDKLQSNNDKLNEIAKYIFEKLGEMDAYANGLLRLANSNQRLLLESMGHGFVDKQMLNLGLYDKTCDRIEEVMQEILNKYRK